MIFFLARSLRSKKMIGVEVRCDWPGREPVTEFRASKCMGASLNLARRRSLALLLVFDGLH